MYEAFFNLRRKPFELLPTPEFLYHSRSHKKVLTYLDYGIREHSGFILLTGEVGTGKTTLIRELVQKHMRDVLLARIFHTKVESLQLLAMINADFGLDTVGKDKPTLLHELHEFLISQYAKRRPVVLIIDEAQNLSMDVLEEVRMLSNLETKDNKLLHIILVGQPELRRVLASSELLQLRQRIQINCNIDPISENEIEPYILHRLETAGNRNEVNFAPECFSTIHKYTRGIPRLINILCDYILLDAFANQTRDVASTAIDEIAQDLSFNAQYWESTPQTAPQETAKPALRGHPRNLTNKIYGVLVHLNRRLKHLEAAQTTHNQSLNDELRATLAVINERIDALCPTSCSSGTEKEPPQTPAAQPDAPSPVPAERDAAPMQEHPHAAKEPVQPGPYVLPGDDASIAPPEPYPQETVAPFHQEPLPAQGLMAPPYGDGNGSKTTGTKALPWLKWLLQRNY